MRGWYAVAFAPAVLLASLLAGGCGGGGDKNGGGPDGAFATRGSAATDGAAGTGGGGGAGGLGGLAGAGGLGGLAGTGGLGGADAGADTGGSAACNIGCGRMPQSMFCPAGDVAWVCSGSFDFAALAAGGCLPAPTNAIRYCCPPAFLSSCP